EQQANKNSKQTERSDETGLVRRLGLFDVTMIVMGGIIGSGIFMNPSVVAQHVKTPFLILAVWVLGGLVALAGSFIYGELAARMPNVGGQYAYIREAIHPLPAFLYGWALLLVIQSGGMAAVALTFSRYFVQLAPVALQDWMVAVIILFVLTVINCLGVRAGSTLQSILMVLKIGSIATLIFCGLFFARSHTAAQQISQSSSFLTIGAAMIPVLFAYGGWQTSTFIAAEMKDPRRHLPLALIIGVIGVVLLYVGVNWICVRVLGPEALASTKTPASDVMRSIFGSAGAGFIAAGIAISTLGFLSQSMLTAPRVYFSMARDGVFFDKVASVHPKTHVPIVAIALQGIAAIVIALSGKYEQILNYVVSTDFIFFGLTGVCVFVLRNKRSDSDVFLKVPLHPLTTLFFIAASWTIVLVTVIKYPVNSLIGIGLLAAGIPIYFIWKNYGRERIA
ncbi:MAG TPA: amino acid permease, partial [Acidobacteriota bacterium]|nr:amino acid permease [Acidobacteriota bacterium]